VGLIFTLKTHKHLFSSSSSHSQSLQSSDSLESLASPDLERRSADLLNIAPAHLTEMGLERRSAGLPSITQEEPQAEEPTWSIRISIVILMVATLMFAFIAEILTDTIQPVTEAIGITQTFVGVVILGLITNVVEIVNAIQFALANNVQLAVEIGASVSIQISLLQMPLLVLFSAIVTPDGHEQFSLIFPWVEAFAVIFAVVILNYLSTDGRANYFHGVSLVLSYILLVISFYFVPEHHHKFER
jgi:Ca2+:H+ antiporter